ncbi:inorganic phosphate transporter [Agitococcus lubricus]|uniref:PiT family inorganic phosphate transporter n=1 Tax=Agitococcus lubricus TaxID=1077255 RepID=A0A2T5IWV0_9GAMM|nr:inorganic phosphate transporter [Agitococcus lubricus]PTQ88412.1 PiT family inorganic phosphate transporter [Agitococcus lubricus]
MEHVQMTLGVVIFLVILALAFDFMNGFHDAANAIATVVSTRVLTPYQAVMLATVCNFGAIFIFELKVAATIGKGTIEPSVIDHYVIFGALVGAIVWNIITWYFGIPSSSSHALIGGLVGAAVAKSGFSSLISSGLVKTVSFILLSPLLGMLLGSLMLLLMSWLFRESTPRKVDRWSRRLQLISASAYAVGHGGNDAQKTIGIIWMLLIAAGITGQDEHVPYWVVVACYAAIGLGTAFGGWRIIKMMGQKITKLRPVGGFCAQTGGAVTLFTATALGVPVSTTHTITGAIVGVGATRRFSAVRWGIAGSIVWAWILTIPCSALISAVFWQIGKFIL